VENIVTFIAMAGHPVHAPGILYHVRNLASTLKYISLDVNLIVIAILGVIWVFGYLKQTQQKKIS